MIRFFITLMSVLLSCCLQAKNTLPFYQIDLILFTHQQGATLSSEYSSAAVSINTAHAVPLRTTIDSAMTPYHLLPASSSQLRQEYWALHRKPQYQVLLHYSWLQPINNQRAIVLPKIDREGWQVEGTLRIRRANYYLLDTKLLFSPIDSQAPFVFTQKQRLKGGDIYYLDHPRAGMLIKVHQLG